MNLKRYFLIAMLAGLGFTALVGIYAVLVGRFDETELKLLATTGTVGVFSLLALCSAIWFDRGELLVLAYAGIAFSALAMLISFVSIWDILGTDFLREHGETLLKLFGTSALSAAALAYVSLIFLLWGEERIVDNIIYFASGCVAVIWFMLVGLIVFEWEVGLSYAQALGVFAILAVTATIAAPIVKRVRLMAG